MIFLACIFYFASIIWKSPLVSGSRSRRSIVFDRCIRYMTEKCPYVTPRSLLVLASNRVLFPSKLVEQFTVLDIMGKAGNTGKKEIRGRETTCEILYLRVEGVKREEYSEAVGEVVVGDYFVVFGYFFDERGDETIGYFGAYLRVVGQAFEELGSLLAEGGYGEALDRVPLLGEDGEVAVK